MAKQVIAGRAWEYAVFMAWTRIVATPMPPPTKLALCETAFGEIAPQERVNCHLAANAAMGFLLGQDPSIGEIETITLPQDAKGKTGDPRDIVALAGQNEIGVSCKNRSKEIKGPRISPSNDFGNNWFGRPLNAGFKDTVRHVLGDLVDDLLPMYPKWSDFGDQRKATTFYEPIVRALVSEIEAQSDAVPHLTSYLLGNQDYYLVEKDNGHISVASYNFRGTLKWGRQIPIGGGLKGVKVLRSNTIELDTTDGWSFRMRIHNGDTRMSSRSLKLTVAVHGTPNYMSRYESGYGKQ